MKPPTIARVRALIAKQCPSPDLDVRWASAPKRIVFPTGVMAYVGRVNVSAPGYRPRTMTVNADEVGIRVS